MRVQKGTQKQDAYWATLKKDVAADHRSDDWGLITKHVEKAWAYRHAENPIQAFRDAIKEVRSRAIRDEAELEAVFKGEMIRRGKVVYQAGIPTGPDREDESCAPGKKIKAKKGPGRKRKANAEKASAGARKEEVAKLGRKVASFGRKHYGKRFSEVRQQDESSCDWALSLAKSRKGMAESAFYSRISAG